MIQRILLAILIFNLASSASAQTGNTLHLNVTQATGVSLDPDKLYDITVTCSLTKPLPEKNTNLFRQLVWPPNTLSLSHFVVISPSVGASMISTATNSSTSALILAYAVDQNSGTNIVYAKGNEDGCAIDKPLPKPLRLYALGATNYSSMAQTGKIATAVKSALGAATNAAIAVAAPGLSQTTMSKLNGGAAAIGDINDFFTLFNVNDANATQQPAELRVGDTVISTDYSRIVITVKPIDAAIDQPNNDFKRMLETQVSGQTISKANSTATGEDCRKIAGTMNSASFHSVRDQVFGLTFVAGGPSALNQQQLLDCLGLARAKIAISLGDTVWINLLPGAKFTKEDLEYIDTDDDLSHPPQPPSSKLARPVSELVDALSKWAKGTDRSPNMLAYLTRNVQPNVKLVPVETSIGVGERLPTGIPAIANYLIAKGFYHYGFFVPISDEDTHSIYGSVVGFMAFNVPAATNEATLDQAVGIFPIFKGGKIMELRISDMQSETLKLALAYKGKNTFTIRGLPTTATNTDKAK